jgi:uncharacterized protein with PIN domain
VNLLVKWYVLDDIKIMMTEHTESTQTEDRRCAKCEKKNQRIFAQEIKDQVGAPATWDA